LPESSSGSIENGKKLVSNTGFANSTDVNETPKSTVGSVDQEPEGSTDVPLASANVPLENKELVSSGNPFEEEPTQPNLDDNSFQPINANKADTESLENALLKTEAMKSDFAKQLAEVDLKWKTKLADSTSKLQQQVQILQDDRNSTNLESEKSAKLLAAKEAAIVQLNRRISELEKLKTVSLPEFRMWKGSNGREAEMAFIRWDGDQLVFVNKANLAFKIPLTRLSNDDQQIVESLKD
jgi:hypothetical protein